MKPPGLAITLREGALCFGVTQSNRAIDAIWQAAEECIDAGMDPKRVRQEFAEAWEHYSKERLKWQLQDLSK